MQVGASLLHFFVLTTFTWLLVQAYSLYRAIIKVFGEQCNHFFWVATGAWAVPFLYVVLCIALAWDSYNHDDTCWIDMQGDLALAVVVPLFLLLTANIIICVWLLISLRRNAKDHFTASTVLSIACILGLAWFLGGMSYVDDSVAWQYMFAITMLIQTLVWTYAHLMRNAEVMKYFKNTFMVRTEYCYQLLNVLQASSHSSKGYAGYCYSCFAQSLTSLQVFSRPCGSSYNQKSEAQSCQSKFNGRRDTPLLSSSPCHQDR